MRILRERKLLSTCILSRVISNFASEENLVSVKAEPGNEAVRNQNRTEIPPESEQGEQKIAR